MLLSPHISALSDGKSLQFAQKEKLLPGGFEASNNDVKTLAFFKTSLKTENEQLRKTDANQRSAILQLIRRKHGSNDSAASLDMSPNSSIKVYDVDMENLLSK